MYLIIVTHGNPRLLLYRSITLCTFVFAKVMHSNFTRFVLVEATLALTLTLSVGAIISLCSRARGKSTRSWFYLYDYMSRCVCLSTKIIIFIIVFIVAVWTLLLARCPYVHTHLFEFLKDWHMYKHVYILYVGTLISSVRYGCTQRKKKRFVYWRIRQRINRMSWAFSLGNLAFANILWLSAVGLMKFLVSLFWS